MAPNLFFGNTHGTFPRSSGPPFKLITMHLPIPPIPPQPTSDPSALVRSIVREDVLWNRPVFKAPPLEPLLRGFNASACAEDLRRITLGNR